MLSRKNRVADYSSISKSSPIWREIVEIYEEKEEEPEEEVTPETPLVANSTEMEAWFVSCFIVLAVFSF